MSKENRLTWKMERFCQEFVKCGILIDAYKQAGYKHNPDKPEISYTSAWKVSRKPQVVKRIEFLQKEMEKEAMEGWDIQDSVSVLKKIAQAEDDEVRKADIINAVKELNAMAGYRSEKVDHTSSDGSMSPLEVSKEIIKAVRKKHFPE